jgi:hypothetical protein
VVLAVLVSLSMAVVQRPLCCTVVTVTAVIIHPCADHPHPHRLGMGGAGGAGFDSTTTLIVRSSMMSTSTSGAGPGSYNNRHCIDAAAEAFFPSRDERSFRRVVVSPSTFASVPVVIDVLLPLPQDKNHVFGIDEGQSIKPFESFAFSDTLVVDAANVTITLL